MAPECGASTMQPAPEFDPGMAYVHGRGHRLIRVYETVDARFVLEDFYAKLARFARGEFPSTSLGPWPQ